MEDDLILTDDTLAEEPACNHPEPVWACGRRFQLQQLDGHIFLRFMAAGRETAVRVLHPEDAQELGQALQTVAARP